MTKSGQWNISEKDGVCSFFPSPIPAGWAVDVLAGYCALENVGRNCMLRVPQLEI